MTIQEAVKEIWKFFKNWARPVEDEPIVPLKRGALLEGGEID